MRDIFLSNARGINMRIPAALVARSTLRSVKTSAGSVESLRGIKAELCRTAGDGISFYGFGLMLTLILPLQ
jgi:hypothetical protein